jgi:hypothetical protein
MLSIRDNKKTLTFYAQDGDGKQSCGHDGDGTPSRLRPSAVAESVPYSAQGPVEFHQRTGCVRVSVTLQRAQNGVNLFPTSYQQLYGEQECANQLPLNLRLLTLKNRDYAPDAIKDLQQTRRCVFLGTHTMRRLSVPGATVIVRRSTIWSARRTGGRVSTSARRTGRRVPIWNVPVHERESLCLAPAPHHLLRPALL